MSLANLNDTLNFALFSSTTGGAGAITLTDIAGKRGLQAALGASSGTFTRRYVIQCDNGMRETATGTINAATGQMTRPTTVDDAWSVAGGNQTTRLNLPTEGVYIGFDLTTAELIELWETIAGKADASHTHVANDISNASTVGKSVLTAADAAAVRTAAGTVIGTDVQAYSAKTAAIVALTWAADSFFYMTGTATAAVASATSFGRSLLAAANLAALQAILGTGTPSASTYLRGDGTWATPSGSGDASTNTSSSVDGEAAVFSGTGGKTFKRFTLSGLVKSASGVLSAAVAGTDYVAPGGALGTPSSGTATNLTGLPTAGLVDGAVTLAKQANLAEARVIGRASGAGTGVPTALQASDLQTILGYATAAPSGTGDMPVYNGTATAFQTPAQVRNNLDVTNLVTIPYLAVPANGDESWVLRMRGTGTIDSLTHKGTGITVNVKINSTSITGLSAVAPTGTKTTTNATAANTWADGDEINITFSGASSPTLLAMTLNGTRTS